MDRRQQSVLDEIIGFWRDHQYSPSIRDLARLTGINSTSLIRFYLGKLREDGQVLFDDGISRSIRPAGLSITIKSQPRRRQ